MHAQRARYPTAMSKYYFGFDTSNYTTSFAVCDESGAIVRNTKMMLGVAEGCRGLRQSDAVFQHTVNMERISYDISSFIEDTADFELAAVGASARPRDVEGSYMPCFLVGKNTGASVAAATSVPYFTVSHQAGHVAASLYGSDAIHLFDKTFAAFHVSGGTTDILHVKGNGKGDLDIDRIGGTNDLNAGQVIDRAGVMMGLPFPSGKYMEELALGCDGNIPRYRNAVKELSCNLSGIENKAEALYKSTSDKSLTAAFVIGALCDAISGLTDNLLALHPDIPIVYSGGVMSCKIIKDNLSSDNRYFAPPEFSSDNAAGVAYLTMMKYKSQSEG